MIKLKDSRGKDTVTLGFVTIAFLVGNIGFLYDLIINKNPSNLLGYGTFVSGSILPWLVREYTEKVKKNESKEKTL